MHKIIIVLSILLSACSNAESDAKKVVLDQLKDPDSAVFGEFTLVNNYSACLAVNAHNAMGGYTGFQQALLLRGTKDRDNEEWIVSDFTKVSHSTCISIAKRIDFSGFDS